MVKGMRYDVKFLKYRQVFSWYLQSNGVYMYIIRYYIMYRGLKKMHSDHLVGSDKIHVQFLTTNSTLTAVRSALWLVHVSMLHTQ